MIKQILLCLLLTVFAVYCLFRGGAAAGESPSDRVSIEYRSSY